MMMHIQVEGSLDAVPPADWDELAAESGYYLSHQWLRSIEADPSARAEYVLVRRQAKLVAASPLYDVKAENNDFYQPARLVDGRWTGKYIIAGARRAYANGLLVHPALDAGMRRQTIRALMDAIGERVQGSPAQGALFLYLPTYSAREIQSAAGLVLAGDPLLTTAEAVISPTGNCMDDYLASFSPRRRRKFRHEMSVFQQAGYDVAEESLSACWDEAGVLLGNLQRRYGHLGSDERWKAALRRQADVLSERGVVFGCRDNGKLVAFCLAFPFGETLYVRLAGFDYQALRGAFEYFNLIFYEPLRYLFQHGLRRLHLGRESYDAKVLRGATLAPLWSLAVFDQARADRNAAIAWNRKAAAAWTGRYGRGSRALAHPGWAEWGCSDPP
jgi:uncharacterized protein